VDVGQKDPFSQRQGVAGLVELAIVGWADSGGLMVSAIQSEKDPNIESLMQPHTLKAAFSFFRRQ
jgi:hypothetical protein